MKILIAEVVLEKYTARRPDLEGLEITKGELSNLSGVKADSVLKELNFQGVLSSPNAPLLLLLSMGQTCLFSFLGVSNITLLLVLLVEFIWIIFIACIIKISNPISLVNLHQEVYGFNKVIKDINIIDELEAVGNSVSVSDRIKVIEALSLTSKDLVPALKTERILRENKDFNPELFAVDLTALRALQVSEQASEYGRLFNETLQIAVDVQEEMRKLQGQR